VTTRCIGNGGFARELASTKSIAGPVCLSPAEVSFALGRSASSASRHRRRCTAGNVALAEGPAILVGHVPRPDGACYGPIFALQAGQLTTSRTLVRILNIVSAKARQERVATEGDQAATLQLIIALGRAAQALEQAVRPHMAECGLGLTEFSVLEVLYHKGALPLGEIRDRILVTGASTTYVVKKLEERGLMRRRPCAEDQRIVFGELTAKGRALMDEVFPAHVERLQQATAGLSVAQKRDASRLLRALSLHARRTTGERITEDD
jgi:MarR family 2-MHQ and catechol resistance regulon transcriptional repressor